MKKRLLSWLLALTMAMGMLPAVAMATSENEVDYGQVILAIEASYQDQDLFQAWENVALYDVAFTSENKDAAARSAIEVVTADYLDAGGVMKAIFTLVALGYDPADITLLDESTVNVIEVLNGCADTTSDWYFYTAPFVNLAFGVTDDHGVDLDTQVAAHIDLLVEGLKTVDYSWGVDTPAMTIMGLAPYYNSDSAVKVAVDEALDTIAASIGTDGTYGNANTDAMVILAYTMLGINPDTVVGADGTSLVDGFMGYLCEDGTGFGYADTTWNQRATYQGLLALKALAAFEKTEEAVNPFDFSDATLIPLCEADIQTASVGDDGDDMGYADADMEISFTLEVEGESWFTELVALNEGDTVKDVFYAAFAEHEDYDYEIDGGSYVKSITHPTAGQYGEFSYGTNSGWKYEVNDESPEVGFDGYLLEDGDVVIFYYVMDFTLESDDTVFVDVLDTDWFAVAVSYAVDNGLFNGTTDTTFAPDETMTRAMIWTVLARAAGEDTTAGDSWYEVGMDWAMETGISDGTDSEGAVTREQLAVMLYRYEQNNGGGFTSDWAFQGDFDDLYQVSHWATEALCWMVTNEVVTGTSTTTLEPNETATRAQVATMMMRYLEL